MYDRRTVLAGTFGAMAALAGCQGSGGSEETPTSTATGTPMASSDIDYGGWFDDTDNFDGTVDMRGESSVTVAVGAEGNGGAFAFDPAAVHVDPGTTVTWEWTGEGGEHNVAPEDGDFGSGEPASSGSHEHTFETEGIHLYRCEPHDSLGMRGAVVAGDPSGGASAENAYDFGAATFDAYWYSLYNMSTNIAMSGNGVPFPLNEQMEQLQSQRMPAMLENSEVD
jgi:halocyanin-like protein